MLGLYELTTDTCKRLIEFRLHKCLEPGLLAKSVASLTADPGIASLVMARSHTFMEIDHEIFSMVILFLLLTQGYKRKYVHKVLVNRLVKHAQEKVWLGEVTVSK